MRTFPKLFAVLFCAASLSAAVAQNAVPVVPRGRTTQVPTGVTFNYDAEHGMINANGLQSSPTPMAIPGAPPFTGTLTISINITVASNFKPGTRYHCSVSFVGGELSTDVGLVAGGLETANGFARRTAPGMATCSFTIPFSWSLPRGIPADTGLVVAVGARAITGGDNEHGGGKQEVQRSTFQLLGIETLPTSGFSQSFAFDVTL